MDTNDENNVQGRASYTDEERRELIEEFQSSGLTQAAFCREWNINPKTLGRWLRLDRADDVVSFCEVRVDDEVTAATEARVCFPNGVEVKVPFQSPETLGLLLREVATC